MKKAHFLVSMLIIFSMSLGFLAGCTPAATPTAAPATAAPATAAPATVAPATAAPATVAPATAAPTQSFAGQTINVLLISDKTWVPDQALAFEKLTGAKVNIVLTDYEDMVTKVNASAVAKSGAYDVVPADEPVFLISGFLAPLDDDIKTLNTADIMGLDMRTYQGKTYGMPWLIDNRVFLYNVDLLKKAGFSAPSTTWDEFYTQAKAIKDQGILEYPIMMPWMQHEGEACDVSAWFKSAGGTFFDAAGTSSVINSPENVAALDFLKKLNDAKLVNPESLASKSFAVTTALAQGKAAFGTSWNLLTGMLEDPTQSTQVGKVKVGLFPGKTTGLTGTFDGSETLAITADSKNKDLAWAFIKWITSAEIEKQTFLNQKVLPTVLSLYDDPALIAANPNLPVLKTQRMSILFRPQTAWANEWSSTLQIADLEGITGTKTTQKALDDAKTAIDALMK